MFVILLFTKVEIVFYTYGRKPTPKVAKWPIINETYF